MSSPVTQRVGLVTTPVTLTRVPVLMVFCGLLRSRMVVAIATGGIAKSATSIMSWLLVSAGRQAATSKGATNSTDTVFFISSPRRLGFWGCSLGYACADGGEAMRKWPGRQIASRSCRAAVDVPKLRKALPKLSGVLISWRRFWGLGDKAASLASSRRTLSCRFRV